MHGSDRILDREKLTSVFGYWPSFHDAEVIWIRLDRRPNGEMSGPTVEAMIHAFEMTSEVGPNGFYVLRHHVLVHFCFRNVVGLQLEHFNHQNVLSGLHISDYRESGLEQIHFEVEFAAAYGVGASLYCHEIEILSVQPCDGDGIAIES